MIRPLIFEEWRMVNIDGVVPYYYFVSNLGRVQNIHGQIIKPNIINTGYYVYRLYTGDIPKYKHILAHRLVKLVFDPIENPEQFTVNHEDCDKSHNSNRNLTWMTQLENNIHGTETYHKYGINFYNSKLSKDQLKIIIKELSLGTSYAEIVKKIGWEDTWNNREIIGNIKRGRTYKREIESILNE